MVQLSSLYERKPLIVCWVVVYSVICAAVFTDRAWLRITALVGGFVAVWLVILAATR